MALNLSRRTVLRFAEEQGGLYEELSHLVDVIDTSKPGSEIGELVLVRRDKEDCRIARCLKDMPNNIAFEICDDAKTIRGTCEVFHTIVSENQNLLQTSIRLKPWLIQASDFSTKKDPFEEIRPADLPALRSGVHIPFGWRAEVVPLVVGCRIIVTDGLVVEDFWELDCPVVEGERRLAEVIGTGRDPEGWTVKNVGRLWVYPDGFVSEDRLD